MAELIVDNRSDFAQAVLDGLSQDRKVIPARYFYDRRGSELFEEITRLPEYYPTRTEIALLRAHAGDLGRLVGQGRPLVDFGAGSTAKTPLVLDALAAPVYVPIDISGDFLRQAAADLAQAYPHVEVRPVVGDFTGPLVLPRLTGPLTGFFPGSTIGNFDHSAAVDLLRSLRRTLGPDARLVIGIDTRKNVGLLEAAYDDAQGVTAAFNLNLLHRINRELDADIPIDAFEHRARWNSRLGRIEMHLMAAREITFRISGRRFSMEEGETIHTENSYKYTAEEVRLLARCSGWEPTAMWSDAAGLFGLHLWSAAGEGMQP